MKNNNTPKKNNQRRNNNSRLRRHKTRRSQGGNLQSPNQIVTKYYHHLEQYLTLRKKFFEQFGRAKGKQITKIENNMNEALKKLREFSEKLNPKQKEVFNNNIDFKSPDFTYSINHELERDGKVEENVHITDPHLTNSQKDRKSFKEDTHESEGSHEDYLQYKKSVIH